MSAAHHNSERETARSERILNLVLAGHGDRGAGLSNRNLLAHTEALRAAGKFRAVHCGVLKGEPALEDAVGAASQADADRLCIFPFFMADGYFTGKVLPERIAAAAPSVPWHILPPLGLDPRLAALILDEARDAALRGGVDALKSRLLIVGHGSKIGTASANATRAMALEVARFGAFGSVETAFLEEAPFVGDALAEQAQAPTIVSGFFSGDGMHAGEDVPEAIARSAVNAIYAGPIGAAPRVADLILGAVSAWLRSSS